VAQNCNCKHRLSGEKRVPSPAPISRAQRKRVVRELRFAFVPFDESNTQIIRAQIVSVQGTSKIFEWAAGSVMERPEFHL